MPHADIRVVSLLPAATEIAWALGLGDNLVGRSHECDWPPDARMLPALTRPRVDPAASSQEINDAVDRAFRESQGVPCSLFALEAERLATLEPDLILTQAICNVCAVDSHEVEAVVLRSRHRTRVISLSATTLAGLWADILTVGGATGRLPLARELIARLRARCDSIAFRVAALCRTEPSVPRVAVVEWLDPPMAAGNWVPELVRLAGGSDCLGRSGEHSHWIDWPAIAEANPDVIILAPCGFTLDRTLQAAMATDVGGQLARTRAAREGRLWVMDGHHLINRPGPRLVDSLEVLAFIFHPGRFAFPAAASFARRLGGQDHDSTTP